MRSAKGRQSLCTIPRKNPSGALCDAVKCYEVPHCRISRAHLTGTVATESPIYRCNFLPIIDSISPRLVLLDANAFWQRGRQTDALKVFWRRHALEVRELYGPKSLKTVRNHHRGKRWPGLRDRQEIISTPLRALMICARNEVLLEQGGHWRWAARGNRTVGACTAGRYLQTRDVTALVEMGAQKNSPSGRPWSPTRQSLGPSGTIENIDIE